MPYVLEKGPYFEIPDSLLASIPTRIHRLHQLRDRRNPVAPLAGPDSPSLDSGPYDFGQRLYHLYNHWFGYEPVGTNWVKHLRGPTDDGTTGAWESYVGDVESIVRETLVRGIEVSLGIPHIDTYTNDADMVEETLDPSCLPRAWPIDMYWVCQMPYFQGWVLWRESPKSDDGHVTIVFTTPAMAGLPLVSKITRPLTGPGPYLKDEYASPPAPLAHENRQGLWVIGHANHTKQPLPANAPGSLGVITPPSFGWVADDPNTVVCVAPAEGDGGVLHDGRPYTGVNV